jgi:DNA replication protein DnaC
MAIEKVMIKSPRVLIFNIISLMQQWKEMLPEREKEWVANAMCKLKRRMCRRGLN